MKRKLDLTYSIILLLILLTISGLVFYLFFSSNPESKPTIEKKPLEEKISPSTISPPVEVTKYKGKNVYVLDPRVKIRVEPKPDATVIEEKRKGEQLKVTGAKGDWFEVELDSGKKGWILREEVSDRKPAQRKEVTAPKISAEGPDIGQALDQIRGGMENSIAFINQRSMQLFSNDMVSGFEIRDQGRQIVIYVTPTWYYLPPFQKQYMSNVLAMEYGKLTCQLKLRENCDTNDFPTVSFLNAENKEVARVAANQPLQIFE